MFWNIDEVSLDTIPLEWRHLLPQCKASLDDFFRGVPTELSMHIGFDKQALTLMTEVVKDARHSPEDIPTIFDQRLKSEHPTIWQKQHSTIANALQAEFGQTYIGINHSFELQKEIGLNELDLFVTCKFSRLGGEAYLRSVGIGRKGKAKNGGTVSVSLGQQINRDFDFVKEGDDKLITCDPYKIMTYKALGCMAIAITKEYPNNKELMAMFTVAGTQLVTRKIDEAIVGFTNVLEIAPDSFNAHFQRGRAYADTGNLEKALEDYKSAQKINPRAFQPYFERAKIHLTTGDFFNAILDLRSAIDFQPDEAEIFVLRGLAYMRYGDLPNALKDYTEAIRLRPNYMEALNDRAVLLGNLGRFEEAFKDINIVVREKPEWETGLSNRARLFVMTGMHSEAIEDLKKALLIRPNSSGAQFLYGTALLMSGDNQSAIIELDRAIELNSKNPHAYRNRGTARAKLGDLTAAIIDYSKAISLNPQMVEAHVDRTQIYIKLNDAQNIFKGYNTILKLTPNNEWALNGLAWSLATHKDTEFRDGTVAVKMAEKALAVSENKTLILDTLAGAYAETGQFDKAVQLQRKAIAGARAKQEYQEYLVDFQKHLDSYLTNQAWRD